MPPLILSGGLLGTGLALALAAALWFGASLLDLPNTDRTFLSWISPAAAASGEGSDQGSDGARKDRGDRDHSDDRGDDSGGPRVGERGTAGSESSRGEAGHHGRDRADHHHGPGRRSESGSEGKDSDGSGGGGGGDSGNGDSGDTGHGNSDDGNGGAGRSGDNGQGDGGSGGKGNGGNDSSGDENSSSTSDASGPGGSDSGADTGGSANAGSPGQGGTGSEGDDSGGLAGGDGPGHAGHGDEGSSGAGPDDAAGSDSAAAESSSGAGPGKAAASHTTADAEASEAGPGETAASAAAAGEDSGEASPDEADASDTAASESPGETSLNDVPDLDVEPAAGPGITSGPGAVADEPEVSATALARPDPSPATARELDSDRGWDHEIAREVVVIDRDRTFLSDAQDLGFRVIDEHALPGLGLTVTRLAAPPRLTTIAARNLLRARFPSVLADSNTLYRQQGSRSLPATNYAQRLIGWARPTETCGSELAIGLIDTGVAVDHPAFAGGVIESRSFLPSGAEPAPVDHGTAVAGILVGKGGDGAPPGLLPGATLRVAETFLLDSEGLPAASVVAVAAALDWLIQQRTPVINLSLAGANNLLLATAVQRAIERGAVLVAAAGNGGSAGFTAFPAAYPGVLAVAAVDRNLAPYAGGSRRGYVDLSAPGVDIATIGPDGLSLVSGSSFAAPYVAAAAALRTGPRLPADAEAVHREMARNVLDLGPPGRDPIFGWGLLQAPAEGCAAGPPSPA